MRLSLFWRVFAVNAGLLGAIAVLLLVTPVEIDSPIRTTQALIIKLVRAALPELT